MASGIDLSGFFASLPGFSAWGDDPALVRARDDLAARASVWRFAEGDLVRFPDEAPDGPTWVAEGSLAVLEEDEPRWVGPREAVAAPAGVWIRGQSPGRFVTVAEASWREWLRRHPAAAARLGEPVPPPLPRGLARSPLALEPGEVPRALFRKAPLFPVLRSFLPFVLAVAFLAFGLTVQLGLQTPLPWPVLWLIPGVGLAFAGGLTGLFWWEWAVSVLVVTDRSVLVRQVDVWSHRSEYEKLSLDRLKEAVQTRGGWTDRLLGLVTVELEGDSPRGRLRFRGLARTSEFLKVMEDLKARRKTEALDRTLIRRALADRAGGSRTPVLDQAPTVRAAEAPRTRRLGWRVEKAGAVWFRRHPWHLAGRCLPWVGAMALVLGLAWTAWLWNPLEVRLIAGVTLAVLLVPLGKILWEAWDWADDRLGIEGGRIVLIHRKPLWLGEVKREGPLAEVEQVGVRKASMAALVLDFGDLTLSLGAAEPLVFEDAAHPEWVQNEIFHRRTLLAQEQQRQEARTRLNEVGEILDTWDQARHAGFFEARKKEQP